MPKVIHTKLNFVLRRLFQREPLGLYSYLKRFKGRRSSTFKHYITYYRNWRILGSSATLFLLVLSGLFIAPLYHQEPLGLAIGTAAETSLTLSSASSTASVSVTPSSSSGTFASSSADNSAKFTVTSTNYTGYNLTLTPGSSNDTNQTLSSTNSDDVFTSITDAGGVSSTNFASSSYTSLNNKWGIGYDSSLNGASSSSVSYDTFYPASSTLTVGSTTSANGTSGHSAESDVYYVGLGVRASSNQTVGVYNNTNSNNTYILTATGNKVAYTINFSSYESDVPASEVSNLPAALSSSTNSTSVQITNDKPPTRTGYTFKSWCLGTTSDSGTTCNGTTYKTGDIFPINQTTTNVSTLYAVWTVNSYTQTVTYYCQTATNGLADGGHSYNEDINYGSTFTFTAAKATSCNNGSGSSFNSTVYNTNIYTANNGTATKTISYKVTRATSNVAYFNRNTRTVTLSKGTGINTVTVTGTGIKSGSGTASATVYYGGDATIAAALINSTTYSWANWTGSATYANQSQNISSVTSNLSFTANGKENIINYCTKNNISNENCMQTMTASNCTTTAKTVYDNRDGSSYLIQRLADNKCWMLDNLRLDPTAITLTNLKSRTNATDAILTYFKNGGGSSPYPSNGVTSSKNASYNLPYIDASEKDTTVTGYGSGSKKRGVYYNYCAASAGSYCYTSTGANSVSYDICPTGWRMPTGGVSGEYQALCTATWGSTCSNGMNMAASNPKSLQVILSTPLSGGFLNGSFINVGSYGSFWTATPMYGMNVSGSNASPYDGTDRFYGISVRCILK